MIEFKTRKALKDLDSVSLAVKLRGHFVRNYPLAEVQRLDDAIQLASYLHRNDVRRGSRGKLPNPPYIEHPLRVALRLIDLGVTNPDIFIAAVLHDTVEDHPFEFNDFANVHLYDTENEESARRLAIHFISDYFTYGAAAIVEDVSNPILPPGTSKAEKLSSYHGHATNTIKASAEGRIMKFSDFADNPGSLHHHYAYDDPKVRYFIERYTPLLRVFRIAFEADDQTTVYNPKRALGRLELIEEQFGKFHVGLDMPFKV